jgi:hypothetical protein
MDNAFDNVFEYSRHGGANVFEKFGVNHLLRSHERFDSKEGSGL